MIRVLSTNITSPLGMTTEQNYQAVKSGCSALTRYEGKWNLEEPFAASLFTEEQMKAMMVDGFSAFESVVLKSVREALSRVDFDIASDRVVFVLSTAKGNVEEINENETLCYETFHYENENRDENEYPGVAAKRIARELGITTEPIVVCNACISGVAAQILAQRLLDAGLYDYAIVAGCEVQGKFIVSGFQSFKAVTDEICRPFDIERLGLNLGDGAGTMVMEKVQEFKSSRVQEFHESWVVENGCVRNDAYHLSSPHPQGEGYMLALKGVMDGCDANELGTLSVHGTATMYNDQMESKAIERAGLSNVPLTSLKGFYGHTMGAAGVIETIITMCALDEGKVLGARGFEEIGVSGKINISGEERHAEKKAFVKMMSGFGGCNGGVRWEMAHPNPPERRELDYTETSGDERVELRVEHKVRITNSGAWVDGEKVETSAEGKALLKELYKEHIGDYPKFYKMDVLTRLTFVGVELLLKAEHPEMPECPERPDNSVKPESRAVILFNRSSSIVADRAYYETIKDDSNFYPSPAAFLYTLPNLTTGEIAIRNHYCGETSFYILPEKNEKLMNDIIRVSFADKKTTSIIAGWIDAPSEDEFVAELSIYGNENETLRYETFHYENDN